MLETAHIMLQFGADADKIQLEKVMCLSVLNTGDAIVDINGYLINPAQEVVLVQPCNSYSSVTLNVVYNDGIPARQVINMSKNSYIPLNDGDTKPIIRKSILLNYRKLI